MTLYNITHQKDMDGMASAALLVRYCGMNPKNAFFADYSDEIYLDALANISKINGSGHVLVITDLCLVMDKLSQTIKAFKKFRGKGNSIIWLDHHEWEDKVTRAISKYCDFMLVGENLLFCGAELVYQLFCKHDRTGDRITKITHLCDFWIRSKSSAENKLMDKLSFGIMEIRGKKNWKPTMRTLISHIAKGDMDCQLINDAYKTYTKKTAKPMREMLDNRSTIKVSRIKIGIGFGTTLSSQDACMALIEKNGNDIGIYVRKTTCAGSIRSVRDANRWGINVLPLAKALNGGGHPLASGIFVGNDGYDLNKKEDRERLVGRIEALAQKTYGKKVPYWQQVTGNTRIRAHHSR
jgi:oligoribonuclease NrnB/cAMP/cGMP phosphodiesterase (DHH superfamily)